MEGLPAALNQCIGAPLLTEVTLGCRNPERANGAGDSVSFRTVIPRKVLPDDDLKKEREVSLSIMFIFVACVVPKGVYRKMSMGIADSRDGLVQVRRDATWSFLESNFFVPSFVKSMLISKLNNKLSIT